MTDPMIDVAAASAFTWRNGAMLGQIIRPDGKARCQASIFGKNFRRNGQCKNHGKIKLADGSTWCDNHSPKLSVTECAHMNFQADVQVGRLTEIDKVTIKGFTADVRIHCADCGLSFRFICPKVGSSPREPMVSADALELRAPLEPAYVTEVLGIPLVNGTT